MIARIALLVLAAAVAIIGCTAPAASPSASAQSSASPSQSASPSDSASPTSSAAPSAEPAESAEPPAGTVVAGDLLRVQVPGLRMRSEPVTDAEIVRELAEGAVVSIVGGPTAGERHDWYEVSHGGLTGWVASGEAHDWLAVIRNGRIGFGCIGCTADGLGALMTVEADGTDARVIWDEFASPAWSPDGSQLAATFDDGRTSVVLVVVLLSPDGEIERYLGSGYGPAWSPDGHRLAFTSLMDRTIELVEGEDQDAVVVTDHGAPTSLHWSPDSHLLAFVGIDCPDCPIGDPIIGEPPMAVFSNLPTGGAITKLADGGNAGIRHWSADGSVITFVENDQSISAIEVREVDVDSGVVTVRLSGGAGYGYAISPDETRVAIGTQEGIVVTDRDGGNPVLVVPYDDDTALMPQQPRWSPDGRWILYDIVTTQGDATYPAVVRADGTEGRQLVEHDGYNAAWQPVLEALP